MNRGSLSLKTAPASALVSVADAKLFLRVDDNGEDTLIAAMVTAATEMVEQFINKKLLTQSWFYYMDSFPGGAGGANDPWWDGVQDGALSQLSNGSGPIVIPLGHVRSVVAVKAYDETDTAATVSASAYSVDTKGPRGRIALKIGNTWPTTILRPLNGVEIEFTVGYGAAATDVPAPLVEAVKETLAYLYEHRGDEKPKLPTTAWALARPYRTEHI